MLIALIATVVVATIICTICGFAVRTAFYVTAMVVAIALATAIIRKIKKHFNSK